MSGRRKSTPPRGSKRGSGSTRSGSGSGSTRSGSGSGSTRSGSGSGSTSSSSAGKRAGTTGRAQKKAPPKATRSGGLKKPGKRTRAQLAGRILGWLTLTFLLMVLGGIGAFIYAYTHISIPAPNADFQAQTTYVYYSDGTTPIGRFSTQNRVDVSLADLPDSVKWAVIAAEDRTFETNVGFDPKGIIRATVNDLTGNSLQGASTITQQYVKVLYLNQQRTISRKIQEGILAIKINQEESKDQILQGYLNTIYFGRGAYGIQAASRAYFGKDAAQLNVKQAAVLAAVINNPTGLDPANGPAARLALLDRYQYVLSGMAEMGHLDPAVAQKDSQKLPKFPKGQSQPASSGQAGFILDMVKQKLIDQGFTNDEIYSGGLRVVTTIDKKLERNAVTAVQKQRPKGFSDKKLHAALASVEPGTGALRAMYAGQDYSTSPFNWAADGYGSQPGSTFKPFALAAGLEDGYSLESTFHGNSPFRLSPTLQFHNDANDSYGKHVPLLQGLVDSINTVFIDLVHSMDNGPTRVFDVATSMGIPKDAYGLAQQKNQVGITLGTSPVRPIDMANAYAGFADRGTVAPWYVVEKVSGADGSVLYQHKLKTTNALPADVAADATYALQQVVKHGTGTAALALGRPAGGKTGTATNNDNKTDAVWFVGFTPQLSTAVMYVRGNGTGVLDGWLPCPYGACYPAHTWTAFMKLALKGQPVLSFPPPAHIPPTRLDHAPWTPKPSPTPTPTPTPTTPPTTSTTSTPVVPPASTPTSTTPATPGTG